jgi:hypothetical protein
MSHCLLGGFYIWLICKILKVVVDGAKLLYLQNEASRMMTNGHGTAI